jgi:isoquinoline 1-oxidoreductase alpha subunit
MMAAAALLSKTPKPNDQQIDTITNLCRCGTYIRIRQAIHLAATLGSSKQTARASAARE